MLSYFHKEEGLSYVIQGFEETPTKLPENLPWAVGISKNHLQGVFDDIIDGKILLHYEKDLDILESVLVRNITILIEDVSMNDSEKKELTGKMKGKLDMIRNLKGGKAEIEFKKQLQLLLDNINFDLLWKTNKLYYVKLKGLYVTSLREYMSKTFFEQEKIYVDILIRVLKHYLDVYPWRMQNFSVIQKFIFKLSDVQVGFTGDLRYIQDVLVPRFFALIDKDSLSYKDIRITLEKNKILSRFEMNGLDGKIVREESQEVDFNFPFVEFSETPVVENLDTIYVDPTWKSEVWVFINLFIEFFTHNNHLELDNHRDLLEKNIFQLIDSHISPSKEKIKDLISYYFNDAIKSDYLHLFVEIVYTILYSPDGTVKQGFDADVHRIIEILNQYVQAV